MTALGWVLFLVGTLVASAAGARIPPSWGVFGVGALGAVVGAFLLRREMAKAGSAGSGTHGSIKDLADLRAALDAVDESIQGTLRTADDDALKAGIETTLLEQVVPVVEARLLLSSAHGVEAYARVFTPMAACERCLNRAWSALVDGHPAESRAQASAARYHLAEAIRAWPAR
ncbi:MAG: hypothetical protein VX265_05450 [Myxococcota bacterium]|nr:hypothetical protein [Myxococcota bacterium]